MFGEEFFPTPLWIAHKMLEPLQGRIRPRRGGNRPGTLSSILDPSAGAGDLLDPIAKRFSEGGYMPRLSACEISPELAAILQSKKYDLVGYDFLQFQPDFRIDCIVMNPPFSDGPAHVLHAWDILEPEGELVTLVMATNITRPHTKEMELLKHTVEQHGTFEDLGPAFANAKRPTDVPIGLIRMTKPKGPSKFQFNFKAIQEEVAEAIDLNPVAEGCELAHPDRIGAVVNQYRKTIESFGDVLKAQARIRFFSERSCSVDPWNVALKVIESINYGSIEDAFENFADQIRMGFWIEALKQLGMEKYMTEELRKTLDKFIEQQGKMAFCKENIEKLYETMFLNRKAIMQQAIEAVFDKFTKYHEDNRCHTEGWASNLAWKVNRKVVLPFMIEIKMNGKGLRVRYGAEGTLNDIDKVMCYLSGKPIESITRIYQAIDNLPDGEKVCASTFFKLTAHKKGTLHLEFLDEALWNRFNIEACQGKGWLGKEKP